MTILRHPLSHWLMAARPWSFPASAMPVLATLGYLYATHSHVNWFAGFWALANIVVFHAAGNTWSDYVDYRRGVDSGDTLGVRTLTAGLFEPAEVLRLSVALLSVALLGGVCLLAMTGWPLLAYGIGGLLCALLYPPMKYRAMGDVVIFLAYAFLPTLGTVYACTLSTDWGVLPLALPMGLITVAILHVNNTRDMATDRRANICTLAMLLGGKRAVVVYCIEVLVPFVWTCALALLGVWPLWVMLVLIALVPAIGCVRCAVASLGHGSAAMACLDQSTARLQLLFSLMLALGFVISGIES